MRDTMRALQPLCSVFGVALIAACLASAEAQPGLHPVSDPKGLFSISIPWDWSVASSQMSEEVFHGLRTSGMGQRVISTLAARSGGGDGLPAILAVAAVDLPERVSPAAFAGAVKGQLPSGWEVTQDGRATIAGHDAHYLYFIMHQTDYALYMVMTYFNVGRTGFLVVGGTLNEQDAIRKHFATISQILETFHPSSKLGAFAVR
jgi:hypothetical protein